MIATQEPCFPAVFVFGDSLSDTGNGVLTGISLYSKPSKFPYGETFPGRPAGRFSDGRVLVDFLATYIGLPLLNPSLDSSADFSKGVNYAVSGCTALNASYLASRGISTLSTDFSLELQIGWHLTLKGSESSAKKPSENAFVDGLYVLEIGGNDYIFAAQFSKFSPAQIFSELVPLVVDKIRQAVEVLYVNGARHFLFIGVTPFGCSPAQLNTFPDDAKDEYGCLQDLNSIAYKHGSELQKLLEDLRGAHPNAEFLFADYYGAYIHVLGNSLSYGFTDTLDACCGAGKIFPHNFNKVLSCSSFTARDIPTALCPNPSVYLNWDGIHYTDKFNSYVFDLTVRSGAYLNPLHGFRACNG